MIRSNWPTSTRRAICDTADRSPQLNGRNTTAKLSGLVTEVPHSHWTPADLRPAVEDALDAFGPERLMFGSDWPVCLLASSYQRWVDTLAELLEGRDGADQASVWGGTARRVYGLEAS
ncbi:amidohydrolase family protein [Micromonospora sp. NPDC047753]|uniref:amidohydrolase family protein n=1 Tax=Micromonospora sp. NPDC047753 TaxID=3154817 RepID=UPI0033E145D5